MLRGEDKEAEGEEEEAGKGGRDHDTSEMTDVF